MRDAWLTTWTVVRLVAREHGPLWRRRLAFVGGWALAIGIVGLTLAWVSISVDHLFADPQHPSLAWWSSVGVLSVVGMVVLLVRTVRAARGLAMTGRAGLRLAWSDPNGMMDLAVFPAVKMAVDGQGWERLRGLAVLMVLLVSWPALFLMFGTSMGVALAVCLFEMVFGTPEVRRFRREAARQRRVEADALRRAHGSALSRWQREVLARHPDAARELEQKILRHAADSSAPASESVTPPRARL